MIIDYCTIISDNTDSREFDEKVKSKIDLGWQPYGAPMNIGAWKMCQCLVKYNKIIPTLSNKDIVE